MSNAFRFTTQLWLYVTANGGWHFVSVPPQLSKLITARFGQLKRGWGSLRVRAKIGDTVWQTSIFPDKKRGGYLLPVKASVRASEKLLRDAKITVRLWIQV